MPHTHKLYKYSEEKETGRLAPVPLRWTGNAMPLPLPQRAPKNSLVAIRNSLSGPPPGIELWKSGRGRCHLSRATRSSFYFSLVTHVMRCRVDFCTVFLLLLGCSYSAADRYTRRRRRRRQRRTTRLLASCRLDLAGSLHFIYYYIYSTVCQSYDTNQLSWSKLKCCATFSLFIC